MAPFIEADGRLDHALVNGEDAGSAILLSQETSAAMEAEISRLESRLKAPGLSSGEKLAIQHRIDDVRKQIGGEERLRHDKETAIATTPVRLAYDSEGLLAAGGNPFGKAAGASWDSLETMLSVVLMLIGLVLPWALLAGAVVLLVRYLRIKRRMN